MLAIELEALVPVHAYGDGQVEVAERAVGEFDIDEPAVGAEALQIFESHAGVLPEKEFRTWVLEPIKRIVRALRARWPVLPIIGFPRGAGAMYVPFAAETGVSAVSLDTTVPLSWADTHLPAGMPIQGNLDPVYLLTGGDTMDGAVNRILSACVNRPHIFNLGHGMLPETNPEKVKNLVKFYKEYN